MAEEKKLDSLLERIYQDGVEKSNKKADEIISNAKSEADRIIKEAEAKSEEIIKEAERKSEELRKNTETDVRMAGEQSISALKQRIKDLVTAKVLEEGLKDSFADASFLKDLILEVVKKWDINSSDADVTVYFPESKRADIDSSFERSIKSAIKNASINFDKKLSNGFKIVPEGGNYQLQFTDEDFVEFFSDYIKAKTEEVIFSK
ncbi:V-type ATP synthase subunit E [Brachyspira hyodysenteriae]|uniref:V-type ATP synthase subunit E n=1 Tax=Brachyspira hyodysenteriae TaxID=159 RepID=UPI0022CD38B4|nr:V-type ATP synthase subunit E [Brachyspira hyodysenteriae]MCZ9838426.1 V-type ATP synthase subunit E [Brachyspira hyodysenteriae]MCZ9849539.1 V-type ATP synthase subunit E [Brachyspira hyodysenteriae]MCZ9850105.1 V-type ATP synthase subunit E [Brachyspira hyodysenteriae]MCZ9861072.1 V-type ATP synthase subunit E [Brachyspira hyodysenteriae]MCZ9871496.1 V-type ATP synthase subunit E [Brachyspira hyodysenteriae]